MIKETLRRYFTKKIYPTYRGDWYKLKGYEGNSHNERFSNFVKKQRSSSGIYHQEFKNLKLIREFIGSGSYNSLNIEYHEGYKIDSVSLIPSKSIREGKAGNNLYIICFHGRREYYESRFRDMALMAKETGATVMSFNPKGFHSSTGKTKTIQDIVNDGIAVVEHLLKKNISHRQIVFYGNSLGSALQALVCRYFQKSKNINFRQINSNSFRNLSAVFAVKLGIPFFEKQLYTIMKYSGWEIDYDQDFYQTGIYRCYLTREDDKTILAEASFASRVNLELDLKNSPQEYQETMQWLRDNSQLIIDCNSGDKKTAKLIKDSHDLALYRLCLKNKNDKGENFKVWEFFNRYLEASNHFI